MGCIPTKTQVGSAKAIEMARRGEEFGFRVPSVEVDWPRIVARKNAIVASMVTNLETSLRENPRITLLRGNARFAGPTRLDVDGRSVEAEKIIVGSGRGAQCSRFETQNEEPLLRLGSGP